MSFKHNHAVLSYLDFSKPAPDVMGSVFIAMLANIRLWKDFWFPTGARVSRGSRIWVGSTKEIHTEKGRNTKIFGQLQF